MDRDERVFIMGEEVGLFRRRHSRSLTACSRFTARSAWRDTPISEAVIVGAASAAAMAGSAVVEL